MPVTKPRTRLVNFRLSEDEFNGLQAACQQHKARSLSDFTRAAVLDASEPDHDVQGVLRITLASLDTRMEILEIGLRQLLHQVDTVPAMRQSGD